MTRIERRQTPNYTPGREGHAPRGIVIHTTDGPLIDTLKWFANPRSRVSAHYVVAWGGRVYQLVEETDTARHAGRVAEPTTPLVTDENPNLYTIGIEFEDRGKPRSGKRPARQYRAGARLVRAIADRWGIPLDRDHVVGHREIRGNKDCPGDLDVERLIRRARGR
jgi:N-acetyl-anhydromuramyl-L-alanine amidase AmpD